jgi:glycosyltransferase involved in cell wall biosynthesis
LAFSPALYRAACELAASSDLVHLHSLWHFPQYAGYRAASRARTPYIVSPHGALDPYLRRRGRVRKGLSTWLYQERLLREASLIHVTTDAEADLIADVATEVPRSIVPCGLYVQEFRELPAREVFRRRYLHGYGGPVILFLGRITYKKGVERLLRAFAHVRRQGECRLVVVGPDDEGLRPGLERLALELKVAQDVHFLGPLYGEERRAALATADVWALCSYTENFGIAVIEAMAAGCAVCISPGVNVSADVTGAEAGVVAGLEPEEFGAALAQLLADDARRLRLGSAARRFADRYDWSAVTPRLLDMYRRAVAQPDR